MRNYEAVVIVDPRLDEASIRGAIEKFTGLIEAKGEAASINDWGRRRLAYPIRHLEEGHYVVAAFKANPDLVDELEHLFRIGEEYVRAKIVRTPEVSARPEEVA
jgi:small subunit ribosomal protein S6